MALAAVTGLAAEASIARHHGILAEATGGDPRRTAAAAERMLAAGASLLSFGIAGALAPGLAPGTLLLPLRVLGGATAITVDAAWQLRVAAALDARGVIAVEGDLVGAAAMIATPAAKAELHRRSGAVAVDLESYIAAAAAQRSGRPFLVLRAVADPAGFALPPAAAIGLDEAGRVALGPVIASILRHPGQLPGLWRLARHTRAALVALARAAAVLAQAEAPGLSRPRGEG